MRHLTSEELSAHLDRALTGRRAEEAERHLAACEACREALANLAAQDAALRPALTHDPGEAYFEGFADRLARRLPTPHRMKAGWGFGRLFDSPRTLAWVSAAAVIVVGAGVVLMARREVVPPNLRDRELAERAQQVAPGSAKEAEAPARPESRLRGATPAPAPATEALEQDFAAPPRDDDAARTRREGAASGPTANDVGRLQSRADQPSASTRAEEKDKFAAPSVGGKRERAAIVPPSAPAGAANERKAFAAAPAAPAPGTAAPGRAVEVRRNAAGEEVPLGTPVTPPAHPSVTTTDELSKARKKLAAEPLRDALERETSSATLRGGRKPASAALGETQSAPPAAKPQALEAPLASSALAGAAPSARGQADLEPTATGEARVCGVVLDAMERPIVRAQVMLTDLGRVTATDQGGHFCLEAPVGEHPVSVMALGFAPRRQTLRFGGEPAAARMVLDPVPVLDQKRPLPQRVPPRQIVRPTPTPAKEVSMSLRISSSAFKPNGAIPARHTCDGEDVSPPLAWTGIPAGTRSLVLIVDDPDAPDPAAPKMTWVHWVLYDLPPSATGLAEHATTKTLPAGTREGLNDWKQPGWRGPCPPIGRHRYFFKLYALDTTLAITGADKGMVTRAMQGHILAHAEQVGTYAKK